MSEIKPVERYTFSVEHETAYQDEQGLWVKFADYEALKAENEELKEDLQFVERWANHHGTKPNVTAQEALSCIQHYPSIAAITKSYKDGVIPNTRNPYAELEAHAKRIAELEDDNKYLKQLSFSAIDTSNQYEIKKKTLMRSLALLEKVTKHFTRVPSTLADSEIRSEVHAFLSESKNGDSK